MLPNLRCPHPCDPLPADQVTVVTPLSSFSVRLPGLDDTFHLVPDSALPDEDRTQRAQDRAIRLAASPTPEIVRGAQDILTRIDDVQDGLVTLSLVTRFAAARNPIRKSVV